MRNRTFVIAVALLCAMSSLVSCGSGRKKPQADSTARTAIIREVRKMKDRLPMRIAGTDFTVLDVDLQGDEFVYVVSVPDSVWEEQGLSQADANSDKNIARILSNADETMVGKLIDARLGFKYVYRNGANDSTLMTLTLGADKMADVRRRVKEGTLEPFTMLELAEKEIARMKIPSLIGEGIWLTDAYIKNGNVYYEAMMEEETEPWDGSVLSEVKGGIVEGLLMEPAFMQNRKLIKEGDTHFIYLYKDNRGKRIAEIDVSPADLFDED